MRTDGSDLQGNRCDSGRSVGHMMAAVVRAAMVIPVVTVARVLVLRLIVVGVVGLEGVVLPVPVMTVRS